MKDEEWIKKISEFWLIGLAEQRRVTEHSSN
jgi:hypothetical protein